MPESFIDLVDLDIAALIAAVNTALEAAPKSGGVNWGDLSIHDIEYRTSLMHPTRKPSVVVHIEEATPGCALERWLNECIGPLFPGVYVECEW